MSKASSLQNFCSRLKNEEDGQALVEYVLILSVSLVAAAGLVKVIASALDTGILRLGAQLEKDLKTGRAKVELWAN